ncbi:MAG TPA: hypothetical protein VKU79_07160 [Thermoplasmataceae archaeon]|nr:hypothetical protein [Thermoplasmataceae archaeon]
MKKYSGYFRSDIHRRKNGGTENPFDDGTLMGQALNKPISKIA